MMYKHLLILVLASALGACLTVTEAPVDSRQTGDAYSPAPVTGFTYEPEAVTRGFHQVVQGDTLYSISFRYGLDYRDVALWNNISGNYVIHPGQKLALVAPAGGPVVKPLQEDPDVKIIPLGDPNAKTPAGSNQLIIEDVTPQNQPGTAAPTPPKTPQTASVSPSRTAPGVSGRRNVAWRWPTTGELLRSNSPVARKGVDISGREGQQIHAAADGVVVYSGSGLLGYGKLIIIKHNDTYLSAYAHNQAIQVKEGEPVSAGQPIGTMGKGNKGQPLLHFEIRKDGKPVDPLQYLPARS